MGQEPRKPFSFGPTNHLRLCDVTNQRLKHIPCSHDDSGGFTGKKDELKESEVYPILFGEAVADFFVGSTAVS